MAEHEIGDRVNGHVCSVPVTGWWTGRGIKVWDILDDSPLDMAMGLHEKPLWGRLTDDGQWVEIGGEYLVDDE